MKFLLYSYHLPLLICHCQKVFLFVCYLNPEVKKYNISLNLKWIDSYRYSASLHGLPDLPKWIQLTYSPILKMGFMYGTPPSNLETQIKVWFHPNNYNLPNGNLFIVSWILLPIIMLHLKSQQRKYSSILSKNKVTYF